MFFFLVSSFYIFFNLRLDTIIFIYFLSIEFLGNFKNDPGYLGFLYFLFFVEFFFVFFLNLFFMPSFYIKLVEN